MLLVDRKILLQSETNDVFASITQLESAGSLDRSDLGMKSRNFFVERHFYVKNFLSFVPGSSTFTSFSYSTFFIL